MISIRRLLDRSIDGGHTLLPSPTMHPRLTGAGCSGEGSSSGSANWQRRIVLLSIHGNTFTYAYLRGLRLLISQTCTPTCTAITACAVICPRCSIWNVIVSFFFFFLLIVPSPSIVSHSDFLFDFSFDLVISYFLHFFAISFILNTRWQRIIEIRMAIRKSVLLLESFNIRNVVSNAINFKWQTFLSTQGSIRSFLCQLVGER